MKTKLNTMIASFCTLLPVGYGLSKYQELPAKIPIHFNNLNQPNNYASKPVAVFLIPVLMVVITLITAFATSRKQLTEQDRTLSAMTLWLIPILTNVLYFVMIDYSLGHAINVTKITFLLVSFIFIGLGAALLILGPQSNLLHFGRRHITGPLAGKVAKVSGSSFLISGVIFLLVALFNPSLGGWFVILFIASQLLIMFYYSRKIKED